MQHSLYRSDLYVATALALVGFLITLSVPGWNSASLPATHSQSVRLDPNRASLADLTAIPGVGLPTAVRIVRGRPYGELADLVALLGDGRARALAPYLTLD
jgi:DNA uptake protein ComE-like DNA-binding protein